MNEINIVILGYLTNKERKWTRLTFYINDEEHFQNSDTCVGITPVSVFCKGEVFDKLSDKILLKSAKAKLKCVQDYKNPLDTKNTLSEIEVNGHVISLL